MAATATVDLQRGGDATTFTVTPGGARRRWSLFWTGVTFALVGYWTVWAAGLLSWFICVCGVVGAALGLVDNRPKAHRGKSVISVSRRGFDVNGKLYARDGVKRLMIRNPLKSKDTPAREITIVGGDAADIARQFQAYAEARREEDMLAAGTYEIVLDADFKDHFLAGNLDWSTADRLHRSLCDAWAMANKA